MELIDASNSSGSLEFKVSNVDPDVFFPIEVKFSCGETIAKLKVDGVTDVRSGNAVSFSATTALDVEEYFIQ